MKSPTSETANPSRAADGNSQDGEANDERSVSAHSGEVGPPQFVATSTGCPGMFKLACALGAVHSGRMCLAALCAVQVLCKGPVSHTHEGNLLVLVQASVPLGAPRASTSIASSCVQTLPVLVALQFQDTVAPLNSLATRLAMLHADSPSATQPFATLGTRSEGGWGSRAAYLASQVGSDPHLLSLFVPIMPLSLLRLTV